VSREAIEMGSIYLRLTVHLGVRIRRLAECIANSRIAED
jgi:hypothetical protein